MDQAGIPEDARNGEPLHRVGLCLRDMEAVFLNERGSFKIMAAPEFALTVTFAMSAIFYTIGAAVMLSPLPHQNFAARVAFALAGVLLWITGIIWGVTTGETQMFLRYIIAAIVGGASAAITVWVFTLTGNAQSVSSPTSVGQTMNTEDKSSVTGAEIIGNMQGGVAKEIISNGSSNAPSIGADIFVEGSPGQSVTGLRVIQSGPGTGLKVIQNGPGIGLRVRAENKPNDK